MDREIPRLQARLDELTKIADQNKPAASQADSGAAPASASAQAPASGLSPEQQKEFVALTTQLKLLTDRRALLLARTGDDYVTDPPKLQAKP